MYLNRIPNCLRLYQIIQNWSSTSQSGLDGLSLGQNGWFDFSDRLIQLAASIVLFVRFDCFDTSSELISVINL